jgi:hypothetical protein
MAALLETFEGAHEYCSTTMRAVYASCAQHRLNEYVPLGGDTTPPPFVVEEGLHPSDAIPSSYRYFETPTMHTPKRRSTPNPSHPDAPRAVGDRHRDGRAGRRSRPGEAPVSLRLVEDM